MRACVRTCVCVCACLRAYMLVCVRACECACVRVCVRACVCVTAQRMVTVLTLAVDAARLDQPVWSANYPVMPRDWVRRGRGHARRHEGRVGGLQEHVLAFRATHRLSPRPCTQTLVQTRLFYLTESCIPIKTVAHFCVYKRTNVHVSAWEHICQNDYEKYRVFVNS